MRLRIPLVALLAAALVLPGCALTRGNPRVSECSMYVATGLLAGVVAGVLAAPEVSGDNTSTRERIGTGAVGGGVGALAGYAVCAASYRAKARIEARIARLEAVNADALARADEADRAAEEASRGASSNASAQASIGTNPAPAATPARPQVIVETAENAEGKRVMFVNYELPGLLFATGSDQITNRAKIYLDDFAVVLNENPSTQVEVLGHTDDVGTAAVNRRLSERRAQAVSGYLASNVTPNARLKAEGRGSLEPKVQGTTPAARAANRRVEIRFAVGG